MQTAANLLDEALEVGNLELEALQQDDIDQASQLAERRSWLVSQAWSVRQGCDTASYRERLIKMQNMQTQLSLEAANKREAMRQGLLRSRKENRRLAGYKQALVF